MSIFFIQFYLMLVLASSFDFIQLCYLLTCFILCDFAKNIKLCDDITVFYSIYILFCQKPTRLKNEHKHAVLQILDRL